MYQVMYVVSQEQIDSEKEWLKDQKIYPSIMEYYDWLHDNKIKFQIGLIIDKNTLTILKMRHNNVNFKKYVKNI